MEVINALWVDEIRKRPDGGVDLLGVFEDLYLDEIPVTLENLSLYVEVTFGPGDRGQRQTLQLHLTDETGQSAQEPSHIRFGAPPLDDYPRPSAPLDLALFEVTFRRFGAYQLDITVNGEPARRVYLYVHSRADHQNP